MAMYDWNHNGKNDMQDDYLEYMIYPNKMSYCLINCFLMSCFLMMYILPNTAYASSNTCCFGSVHYYIPALCILVYSLP